MPFEVAARNGHLVEIAIDQVEARTSLVRLTACNLRGACLPLLLDENHALALAKALEAAVLEIQARAVSL